MRKRSSEIIQRMIKNAGAPLTIKKLASEYGISQRTLRNDLKEINQFLQNIPTAEISINDRGEIVKNDGFDDVLVERSLYDMDAYAYRLSTEERQIYIMMVLTASYHHLTMKMFAEELYVSRITIVNDIDVVKEKFKKYNAELLMDPGKGMILQCDEKVRIEILTELYRELAISTENNGIFQRIVLERMHIRYSFSDIFSYVQEYMQVSNLVFVEDVFYDIVLYLFVVFNFFRKEGNTVNKKDSLNGIDHMILYAGYMLNINITQGMLENFRDYINLHELHAFVKTVDEIELYKAIMQFIEAIDKEVNLGLKNDGKLMDALLMHIRNIKDWGNYEVELPTEYDSFIDYDYLEFLVDKNINILERFLSYPLNENMKKSIVIHICVSIIRSKKYMERLSVIIVCPGSMATGKYLEAQIKNYFDFQIVGVLSAGEVISRLEREHQEVDFIISTVAIKTEKYPVIKVHPFLQMDDMNRIQSMVFQKQKKKEGKSESKLDVLKNTIRDLVDDQALADILCGRVTETVKNYKRYSFTYRKNEIGDLLKVEYIQIQKEKTNWKQAMYQSAVPLEKDGKIEHRYIEKAIEHIEEFGDYIIVSDGVALAHANKDYGVIEDGLSLLVSVPGITFQETENKVYLLFCFASVGKHEYLNLLKAIIQIGKEEGRAREISRLEDIKEIYQKIVYHI